MPTRRKKTSQPAQTASKKFPPVNALVEQLDRFAESISQITSSSIGALFFVDEDQKTLSLQAWHVRPGKNFPAVVDHERPLKLEDAGLLADAIRNRKPYIQNRQEKGDISNPAFPFPADIQRLLVLPVINDRRVVAAAAAGGKNEDYTRKDIDALTGLTGIIWELINAWKQTELFQNLVDVTNDWETWVDEKNAFRYCSSNSEKITGFTCKEFEENPSLYLEMIHPDDRQELIDHFNEMHDIREPYSTTFRMKTKNGEERWIELYCRPFFDSKGEYLGRRGSNRDITERKLLELENRKNEESLERSQRIAHLGSYEVDLKSGQIKLSHECYRILGIDEMDPAPLFTEKNKIVHPDDLEAAASQLAASVFSGSEFNLSFRIVRPDGEIRFVQNTGKPKLENSGEVSCVYGTIQDITEKKIIENSLKESEARFRGILENASSMAVQGYAPDGTVQYWNSASTRLYGYTEEEALGKNLLDLIIPPEMREEVQSAINSMFETGMPIPSAELSLMHKDGSRVEVYSSHAIVQRLNHEPELFCIDLDLAARKEVEAALRESEGRFRSLVESISDIIFTLKEDGTILYLSPTWSGAYGIDIDEAVGHSFLEFLHPDEVPMIFNHFDHLIRTGERIEGLEFRIKNANNTWEWHTTNATLQNQGTKGERLIIGITRNISEAKMAEQIRNSEVEIMNICHFARDKQSLLRELVDYFKRLTGLDAVGVRLHEGDDFPFFFVQGFSDEFLKTENCLLLRDAQKKIILDKNGLPVLDCMCGHILSRRFDVEESCFTRFGSFVTNNTSELMSSLKDAGRWGHIRNNCHRHGYESVALLPLHAHGKVFGLFQFNDHRRDCFNKELIHQLENLVDYVSLALANFESTEALRDSEEKYRILVENASEAICVLQDGLCMFCNPKMLQTCGLESHPDADTNFLDSIHPDDRGEVEAYQKNRLMNKPSPGKITCRFLTSSGEIRWVELSSAAITWAGQPATLNFMSDITDRKMAQDALLESETKLHDMIDNFDMPIWTVDRDDKLIIFNSKFREEHLKKSGRQPAIGDDFCDITGEENGKIDWESIHQRVLHGEQIVLETEYLISGLVHSDEFSFIPFQNANREIIGMTVMVRDISGRKQDERERRALEERFYNAFHTSPDSISINSMVDGLFIDINEGFTDMTGYSADEVIGKSALEVNLWANPSDREKMIRSLMDTGEMINLETPIITKKGQKKICLMSAKIIQVNDENCILTIVRDISERKLAEAKLNEQIDELRRWHAVTLGRETRIIDLKNEVNELLVKAGKPPKYVMTGEIHND